MNPYQINSYALAATNELEAPTEQSKSLPDQMGNEISWSEQDVLQSYMPFGNNPDPVVRNKGLQIYNEMLQDDQVKVCLDIRIQARLSTPWEIVAGEEGNAQAEEMADFIKFNLKRMSGNFESDLEQIYSAIPFGFSISEKIFDYIEEGKYAGKIGLKAIKTREPYRYDFKVDAHGNLLGLVYVGITGKDEKKNNNNLISLEPAATSILTPAQASGQMGTVENPFPPEKFIIYSYNQKFGNFYGRSDLLAAFKWWIMKKHGSKFWAIWLERYASPFIWAQYKRDAGIKKEALERIDSFIKNLSAKSGIRVSDAVELFPIQFSGTGADSYEKAIEAFNRYIAHAILFPNLLGYTGGQGSSGGSYSLGAKQMESFVWVLEKMGRDTSETIVGEQIIKQLIKINYGEVPHELMPKFRFISIDNSSIDIRSQIIQRLAQAGFVSPEEEWVRDFLSMPKKDPTIQLPDPQSNNPFDKGNQQQPDQSAKKEKADNPSPKKEEPPVKKESSQINPNTFKQREPNKFEEKIKVGAFQDQTDSLEEGFFDDATEDIQAMQDDLIEKVQKKKIVENGDSKAANSITINVGDLKDTIEKWLVKTYLDSRLYAFQELGRAGVKIEVTKNFAGISGTADDWEPLPPKDAIEFFKRKVTARVIDEDGKRKIVDITDGMDLTYFRQKAFTIAGVVRDDILNDAKQIILNGIKRGDEVSTVKTLKDLFNSYLDQGIAVDGDLLTPNRLNTIVRTNVSEAINEGRIDMMTAPDVGDFVQFFQYTAIMDQRTTDYCRCMDEKVFRIEDVLRLKPPAHFNCRSFTVPITKFEIEDLNAEGKGIEVSEPCFGRADGFADLKRPLAAVGPSDPNDKVKIPEIVKQPEKKETGGDLPPAPKAKADIEATQKLKDELMGIIARCPYSFCNSEDIYFNRRIMNVGEFGCRSCGIPFRMSNKGDVYLYDAGTEVWEKVTIGQIPHFFKEKNK